MLLSAVMCAKPLRHRNEVHADVKFTQPASGKLYLKKLTLNDLPWKTSEQNYIVSWTF
jgi:hypothetical protein